MMGRRPHSLMFTENQKVLLPRATISRRMYTVVKEFCVVFNRPSPHHSTAASIHSKLFYLNRFAGKTQLLQLAETVAEPLGGAAIECPPYISMNIAFTC